MGRGRGTHGIGLRGSKLAAEARHCEVTRFTDELEGVVGKEALGDLQIRDYEEGILRLLSRGDTGRIGLS